MTGTPSVQVMVGYDGSVAAGAAIGVAAELLPGAHARIVHVWSPPFADDAMRRRLWTGRHDLDGFLAAIEREGLAEATRVADVGVSLAAVAGWTAEPLVSRSYGGEGFQLAELVGKLEPDVTVMGSRGLGGAHAVLGSVSDMVVHYAPWPVLVVPHPLFVAERRALAGGPVLVGWDGSPGALRAAEQARQIFGSRPIRYVNVHDGAAVPILPQGHELLRCRMEDGHVPSGRAVAAALDRQAAELGAAVTVVGSRGRSAVREILLGSVAMATLHHTQRPVLVVHRDPAADRETIEETT